MFRDAGFAELPRREVVLDNTANNIGIFTKWVIELQILMHRGPTIGVLWSDLCDRPCHSVRLAIGEKGGGGFSIVVFVRK